jgi:hypothetical protein
MEIYAFMPENSHGTEMRLKDNSGDINVSRSERYRVIFSDYH